MQQLNEGLFKSLGYRVSRIHKAHERMKHADREIRGLLDEIRRISITNGYDDWVEFLAKNHIILQKNAEGRYDITITK